MLICGEKGDGHTSHLAPAVLYDLEGVPVHVLDLPVLYATSTRVPEEACAQVLITKPPLIASSFIVELDQLFFTNCFKCRIALKKSWFHILIIDR